MSKWTCAGAALAVVVAAMTMATPAWAQRDAGAKARGDFGSGFWNSRSNSFYRYVPTYSVTRQENRTFSYQSIGINPGDKVQVTADHARLMDGRRLVTTVDKGQELDVSKVTNGWLLTKIMQDGKKMDGWVWYRNVKLEEGQDAGR